MASLLAFRFLAGLGASAPLSIVGGLYADIWDNPVIRGRCELHPLEPVCQKLTVCVRYRYLLREY